MTNIKNFFLILIVFLTVSNVNAAEVLNPQVFIQRQTIEQVKAKIIERALEKNLTIDSESTTKVVASYEFSGEGDGYRQVLIGANVVRDEIVYLLVPKNDGVVVYARLFISGINRLGQQVRKQLAADDKYQLFGGTTFGQQLQNHLEQLKSSFPL